MLDSIHDLTARIVRLLLLLAAALVLTACGSLNVVGSSKTPSFFTVDANPDWSPDGRLIAFASSRWFGGICLIAPDGTGLRQIFRGNASNVDWSPDGRRIAFQGGDGIYVIRASGGKAARILRGARFSLPAWSPNGRELAVVVDEPDSSETIDVVKADGKDLHRLLPPYVRKSNPHWDFLSASETEPSWSPDGRQIVLQAGDGRIVVVDVASGRRRTIAQRGDEPAWSPDGRLIAFESRSSLWVTNADGSGSPRPLVAANAGDRSWVFANGGDPSWAPDSRNLVFEVIYYFLGGEWRKPQGLSIVHANGSGLRRLTAGHSVDDDLAWRGDLAVP